MNFHNLIDFFCLFAESKNQESPEQEANGGAKQDLTALQNHNLLIALAHGGTSGAAQFAMPVSVSLHYSCLASKTFLLCSITISSSCAHLNSLSKAKAAAMVKMSATLATKAALRTIWTLATCR
jgi:hypothetical protein